MKTTRSVDSKMSTYSFLPIKEGTRIVIIITFRRITTVENVVTDSRVCVMILCIPVCINFRFDEYVGIKIRNYKYIYAGTNYKYLFVHFFWKSDFNGRIGIIRI